MEKLKQSNYTIKNHTTHKFVSVIGLIATLQNKAHRTHFHWYEERKIQFITRTGCWWHRFKILIPKTLTEKKNFCTLRSFKWDFSFTLFAMFYILVSCCVRNRNSIIYKLKTSYTLIHDCNLRITNAIRDTHWFLLYAIYICIHDFEGEKAILQCESIADGKTYIYIQALLRHLNSPS